MRPNVDSPRLHLGRGKRRTCERPAQAAVRAARRLRRRPALLKALADAPGVVGHSGPYPYTQAVVKARGVSAGDVGTRVRHRSRPLDQPKLTEGSWVRDRGAVIEASFADALGIHAGDSITLSGRSFRVAGVAVTAASTPYPKVCYAPPACSEPPARPPSVTPPTVRSAAQRGRKPACRRPKGLFPARARPA